MIRVNEGHRHQVLVTDTYHRRVIQLQSFGTSPESWPLANQKRSGHFAAMNDAVVPAIMQAFGMIRVHMGEKVC